MGKIYLQMIAVVVGSLLLLFLVFNWQGLLLGYAMLTDEERPALLDDARWNDPGSARKFNARFGKGAPESDLIDWLADNDFVRAADTRSAQRNIRSLPCNENITISWNADARHSLTLATARVQQSGCL